MNKNAEKYYNILFIISIFVISVFILIFCVYLSKYTTFYADDLWLGLYEPDEKILDSLYKRSSFQISGGGYLCLFLTKFLNFGLPNLLGLHPGDFISYGSGVFKGLICISIFLLFAKAACFYFKSRKIFFTSYIFIAIYFFSWLYHLHCPFLSLNNNFCRYIVPLMFFILYWQYMYKNITQQNINTKFENLYLFFVIFYALVIETGIEILMYASVLLPVLLIVYNLIADFINKLSKKQIKLFDLNKRFFIPVIFSYIIMFFYNFSDGYKNIVTDRDLNNFLINIQYYKEFIQEYFDIYIIKILPLLLIFLIVTIIAFYFAIKKNELIKVVFPVFMQISIMSIYFSLILLGKSFYDTGDFWLNSNLIQFIYYMTSLYVLFINLGYVLNEIKEKIKEKNQNLFINIFCLIIILPLIILFMIFNENITENIKYKELNIDAKIAKERLYIAEKILRFYYLKNEVPYLPVQLNKTDQEPGVCSAYIWSNRFEEYEDSPCKSSSGLILSEMYYPRIYKDNKPIDMGYCFSNNALEKFYNDGGVFGEKELKRLKFSNLFNEEYIYDKNLKDEILSPKAIIENIETQFSE